MSQNKQRMLLKAFITSQFSYVCWCRSGVDSLFINSARTKKSKAQGGPKNNLDFRSSMDAPSPLPPHFP